MSFLSETNTMSETNNTDKNALDFEQIKQLSKEMSKKAKQEKPLSEKDLKNIEFYVNDMARYIKNYANDGLTSFKYDCSRISKTMFIELANQFKTKNPKFYVQLNFGQQVLIVDWSGKHEA